MRKFFVFTCCVGVTIAVLIILISYSDTLCAPRLTVEDIIYGLESREERIHDLKVLYTAVKYGPAYIDTLSADTNKAVSRSPMEKQLILLAKKGRYILKEGIKIMKLPKQTKKSIPGIDIPETYIIAYNGRKTVIWRDSNNSALTYDRSPITDPLIQTHDIQKFFSGWLTSLSDEIKLGEASIKKVEIINGNLCATVYVKGKSGIQIGDLVHSARYPDVEIVVDVTRDYTPVFIKRQFSKDIRPIEYQVLELKKIGEGIWFPMSGIIKGLQLKDNVWHDTYEHFQVMKVEVNAGLSDELFSITLPPGCHIYDETQKKEYVVPPKRLTKDFQRITFFDKLFGISHEKALELFNEIPFD